MVREFWCIALPVEVIIVLVHEPDSFSTFCTASCSQFSTVCRSCSQIFPRWWCSIVEKYPSFREHRFSILDFYSSPFFFILPCLLSRKLVRYEFWHWVLSWLKGKQRETNSRCLRAFDIVEKYQVKVLNKSWIIKRKEINQFNSVMVWVCFS